MDVFGDDRIEYLEDDLRRSLPGLRSVTYIPGINTADLSTHVLRSITTTNREPADLVIIVAGLNDLVTRRGDTC